MPEEFDPSWEYATFDPEIEEILNEHNSNRSRHIRLSIPSYASTTLLEYRYYKDDRDEKRQYKLILDSGYKYCKGCKNFFKPKKNNRKFCSSKCSMSYTWKHKRQNERNKRKQCPCGRVFLPKRKVNLYCSRPCSDKLRIKPINQKVSFPSGMLSANCMGCGGLIRDEKRKKYCSDKCMRRLANNRYYYKCKKIRIENSPEKD